MIIRPYRRWEQLLPQLYVSRDLQRQIIDARTAQTMARDLRQADPDAVRIYRRLDLPWYGWLAQRMDRARALHAAGQLAQPTWDATRAAFADVWRFARDRWHEQELAEAIRWTDSTYDPPRGSAA